MKMPLLILYLHKLDRRSKQAQGKSTLLQPTLVHHKWRETFIKKTIQMKDWSDGYTVLIVEIDVLLDIWRPACSYVVIKIICLKPRYLDTTNRFYKITHPSILYNPTIDKYYHGTKRLVTSPIGKCYTFCLFEDNGSNFGFLKCWTFIYFTETHSRLAAIRPEFGKES